jgi:hypothetical protein
MRIPWLVVGTLGGLVVYGFILPGISDSRGVGQLQWAIACLIGGLLAGFVLDGIYNPPRPGKPPDAERHRHD